MLHSPSKLSSSTICYNIWLPFGPLVMRAKYGQTHWQFLEHIALLLCVVFSSVPWTHCSPALCGLQLCALKRSHLRTQSVRDSSSICLLFDASLLPRAFIVYPAVYNSDLISQVTVANLIDYSTASLLPPQWAQLVLSSAPPLAFALGYCPRWHHSLSTKSNISLFVNFMSIIILFLCYICQCSFY